MTALLTDGLVSATFPSTEAADAVRRALDEDHVAGDVTTRGIVAPGLWMSGQVVSRECGIVAGLPVVAEVYRQLDERVRITPTVADGDQVQSGDQLLAIEGPARSVITGERVAVNFLQRMSGIATTAARYVAAVSDLGVTILDTRKTVPGLRVLDKYAVTCGGASNHRKDLSTMVLIKENHLAAAGGVTPAVAAICANPATFRGGAIGVEVEVTTLDQAREALRCAVDWVLLDNMSVTQMRRVVALRNRTPGFEAIKLEASGNVTLESVRNVASCGVDAISVGALTHSPAALDVSLLVTPRLVTAR
jgi:nicotinate-nucleotide pyrophosphorylase (carboxylating)